MNWFRNLNLLPKLLIAGLTSMVLMVVLEIASVNYFYGKVQRALETRRISFVIHIGVLKALRAQNNFLITNSPSDVQNFTQAMNDVDNGIKTIARNAVTGENEDMEAMRNDADTYRHAFLEYADGSTAEKQLAKKDVLENLNRAADQIEPLADKQAMRSANNAESARIQLEYISVGLLLLLIPLAVLIFYSIGSSISRPIRQLKDAALEVGKGNLNTKIESHSADEIGILANSLADMTSNLLKLIEGVKRSGIHVTSSSTQIAAAARQLQATVSEQAASTNEVVATAKEISATSRELANTMGAITAVSEETRTLAEAGQAGLLDIGTTMRELVKATESITKRLAVLSAKASNINSIISAIAKVADQTNLLSLNAAIEAEKAGEMGLGFGVVASEIRRLADQTGASTLDIERVIKEMQSAVSEEVRGMDEFSREVRKGAERVQNIATQIAAIIQQVQALSPRFEAVSEGMQSQSLGADVGSSRVDLQACKLEYSIVSPK